MLFSCLLTRLLLDAIKFSRITLLFAKEIELQVACHHENRIHRKQCPTLRPYFRPTNLLPGKCKNCFSYSNHHNASVTKTQVIVNGEFDDRCMLFIYCCDKQPDMSTRERWGEGFER